MRRSRLTGPQRELWPNWRHHCFITDRRDFDARAADAYHRDHARVELVTRDLKAGGQAHCPSGRFSANAARLACGSLAHNIARWTARLGHAQHPDRLTVAATIRNRLLNVAGRVVDIALVARLDPDTEKLMASTADGDPLPAAVIERLAGESSWFELVISAKGVPMWKGRNIRRATESQFQALMALYGGCAGCGEARRGQAARASIGPLRTAYAGGMHMDFHYELVALLWMHADDPDS